MDKGRSRAEACATWRPIALMSVICNPRLALENLFQADTGTHHSWVSWGAAWQRVEPRAQYLVGRASREALSARANGRPQGSSRTPTIPAPAGLGIEPGTHTTAGSNPTATPPNPRGVTR